MKMKTNAENRKEVVKAVAEILNIPSKYLGVPSCKASALDLRAFCRFRLLFPSVIFDNACNTT